jgi:hypothetical protein
VPDTNLVKTVDKFKCWGEGRKLPWVLKADGTRGGRGVRVVHTLKEAEQFFLRLNHPIRTMHFIRRLIVSRDPFVLRPWWSRSIPAIAIQSHIQGRPSNCAVVCWSEGYWQG